MSAIRPVRTTRPPLPPVLAKVVIRSWLGMGDFEVVLQIKRLSVKVFQNKGLTGDSWHFASFLGQIRCFPWVMWLGFSHAGRSYPRSPNARDRGHRHFYGDVCDDVWRTDCLGPGTESLGHLMFMGFITISLCAWNSIKSANRGQEICVLNEGFEDGDGKVGY